ncbi:hypothetical protein F383_10157 [Gossypium arboreum]|uniref:Uncharacterized protein n=1 Tax=Gossypium arboreum TaxID=29729 RepID=A0A0B0MCT6_GOSAR|nr:hypothetical protein F383_10845 [Gossypium arboreum]KHG23313.1 hypothetical protein F383_10157 [Gossypium arboreum]
MPSVESLKPRSPILILKTLISLIFTIFQTPNLFLSKKETSRTPLKPLSFNL